MKINKIRMLYHGSAYKFDSFDLSLAKQFKDYGKGIYFTFSLSQAQKWAQKKARARNKTITYIYQYKISEVSVEDWNILELLKYDKEWIDFITYSRVEGRETIHDIIYDRIADNQFDKISDTLRDYYKEKITVQDAIELIKCRQPKGDQYCFKTEKALKLLNRETTIVQHFIEKRWVQEEYR